MLAKPPACAGCPLASHGSVGFVPPSGPLTPKAPDRQPSRQPSAPRLVLVGQGPGEQEAEFGEPFYRFAPSGQRLRGWLRDAGIDERSVSFGNVIQCWTPARFVNGRGRGNREPTFAEMGECWRRHVGPWLHSLPPDAEIVAVGKPATQFLLGLGPKAPTKRLLGVRQLRELPPLANEVPDAQHHQASGA